MNRTGMLHTCREFLSSNGINKSDHFRAMKMFAVEYCQYPPKLPTGKRVMAKICVERWNEFTWFIENELDWELINEIIPQ